MTHHGHDDHEYDDHSVGGCADRTDAEEAAERTATATGFAGSVLGAVGGPAGATLGGLVGGTAGYLAGYTAAKASGHRDEPDTGGTSSEIPVDEEGASG